jgi:DNA uptake protein ComE-like DNA-binding protein
LWGIGEVRAQQIVNNRPYTSLEELMTKAGIPKNVYEANAGKIQL